MPIFQSPEGGENTNQFFINRIQLRLRVGTEFRHGKISRSRRSFACDVRKEVNEKNGDELATAGLLRTPEFVKRVHGMMYENPGNSMHYILPRIFRCLKEE
ncbi:hypothetical protein ACTXT7_008932 [Hymenolepis weldensis]